MSNAPNVPRGCGYTLTMEGREALKDKQLCRCQPRIDGLFVSCHECGTVYDVLRSNLHELPAEVRGKHFK